MSIASRRTMVFRTARSEIQMNETSSPAIQQHFVAKSTQGQSLHMDIRIDIFRSRDVQGQL